MSESFGEDRWKKIRRENEQNSASILTCFRFLGAKRNAAAGLRRLIGTQYKTIEEKCRVASYRQAYWRRKHWAAHMHTPPPPPPHTRTCARTHTHTHTHTHLHTHKQITNYGDSSINPPYLFLAPVTTIPTVLYSLLFFWLVDLLQRVARPTTNFIG